MRTRALEEMSDAAEQSWNSSSDEKPTSEFFGDAWENMQAGFKNVENSLYSARNSRRHLLPSAERAKDRCSLMISASGV